MDKFDVLKQYFGYESFRGEQAQIIDGILSGRDNITIMPTGGGKSLCYQIPSVIMAGTGLVISPLISLMKDQVNALNLVGIKSAYINSSLSEDQRIEVLRRARLNEYKLIYVAPEQLLTPRFLSYAKGAEFNVISVDEAHCVSQWGQDFRPGYLDIQKFIKELPLRPTVAAFTATATQGIKEDIIKHLDLENPLSIVSGFDRPNLYYEVRHEKDKFRFVQSYLSKNKGISGIIYCQTRKEVERVSQKLSKLSYRVGSYHAGMTIKDRNDYQDGFLRDEIQIMVATNAFGMGIDKSNVNFVIHYNMPKNVESYYQEAGRAGRDGTSAECILLFSGRDVITAKFFIDNEASSEQFQALERERLRTMIAYSKTSTCLRQFVLDYFDDTAPTRCDNCINCLGDFETREVSVDAQKILSCVVRTGERFGAVMICDVLKGSRNQKVLNNGFDLLSTYGLMKTMSTDSIRMVIDYLVEEEILGLSDDSYSTLHLLPLAKSVLSGELKLTMRVLKHRSESMFDKDDNSPLFQTLRQLRKEIADAGKVPAFVIFSDASLKDMCSKLPRTYDEFLEVSGVGKVKADAYSKVFIEAISSF